MHETKSQQPAFFRDAAKISFDHKIPMADSIIFATTRAYEATVWTLERGLKKFSGVKFIH